MSYVRLAFEYEGQRYLQDLTLAAGDLRAGQWSAQLPAGEGIKRGELSIGDTLFNEDRVQVEW